MTESVTQPMDPPAPLAVVRYGLAKEIHLFPDALSFLDREEDVADTFALGEIQKIIVQPGEKVPSKLIVLLELRDGTTLIAGEGMTNVRDFLHLLDRLHEIAPEVALEPEDMASQLDQAVRNRRLANLGCYGFVLLSLLLVVVVYLIFSGLKLLVNH